MLLPASGAACSDDVLERPSSDPPAATTALPLTPRVSDAVFKRTWATDSLEGTYRNRIAVKFADDTGVRARRGALSLVEAKAVGSARHEELAEVRSALVTLDEYAVVRIDSLHEDFMEEARHSGETRSGRQLPDLNTWVYVYAEFESRDAQAELLNHLNSFDIVEIAEPCHKTAGESPFGDTLPWPDAKVIAGEADVEPESWEVNRAPSGGSTREAPEGRPPGMKPPSPSSGLRHAADYQSDQVYWDPSPWGIDVEWLWTQYVVAGSNTEVADIELGWNRNHVEFSTLYLPYAGGRIPYSPAPDDVEHGTAVLGIIGAVYDGHGVTGAVPDLDAVNLSAECTSAGCNFPAAFDEAWQAVESGGVVLIEQQLITSVCGCQLLPVEYDTINRQRIQTAVANGRVVIETAGNGGCSLDLTCWGGLFDPGAPTESGAIMVGAGTRISLENYNSNYGPRVDVHAEGDEMIVTAGYGYSYSAEGQNHYYTDRFCCTSAASAIIAAGAAYLNSIGWSYHGSALGSREMRELFRRGGMPPAPGSGIGNRPDLRRQVGHLHNRSLRGASTSMVGASGPDYVSFNPENGRWTAIDPIGAFGNETVNTHGQQGDIPVPGNYVGTAPAERAVFRPSNGHWIIDLGYFDLIYAFGEKGDIPVPLNYWGETPTVLEPAVYKPYTTTGGGNPNGKSTWKIRIPKFPYYRTFEFGDAFDQPLVGDFDNNGLGNNRDDLVVYNEATGIWKIELHPYASPQTPDITFTQPGGWDQIPLICKRSGRTTIATYSTADFRFRLRNPISPNNIITSTVIGAVGDVPMCADTDGNGDSEFIVFRPRDAGGAGLGAGWYNASYGWTWPSQSTPYDYALAR